jgi:hypothetical protein
MNSYTSFEPADMKEFEPDAKVGLIATLNREGLPHITLITALQAKSSSQLMFGQFTEGLSKKHVKSNPRTGFIIMSLSREMWRGKALWKKESREGEDYDMFNHKPMFRYNSYFGIHTVHYMDLVETYGREKLPMASIVKSALITKLAKGGAHTGRTARILSVWAENLFNRLDALKFISFAGDDGYPVMIPVIQCQAADSTRLAFSTGAYGDELMKLPGGTPVAVFGLTLDMEDILVRGVFKGFSTHRGCRIGTVDINWVYNSMPPKQGQVYPRISLKPVSEF